MCFFFLKFVFVHSNFSFLGLTGFGLWAMLTDTREGVTAVGALTLGTATTLCWLLTVDTMLVVELAVGVPALGGTFHNLVFSRLFFEEKAISLISRYCLACKLIINFIYKTLQKHQYIMCLLLRLFSRLAIIVL